MNVLKYGQLQSLKKSIFLKKGIKQSLFFNERLCACMSMHAHAQLSMTDGNLKIKKTNVMDYVVRIRCRLTAM